MATEPVRITVWLPEALRQNFKSRVALDGESMTTAAERLITLYLAGKLPAAEPKGRKRK